MKSLNGLNIRKIGILLLTHILSQDGLYGTCYNSHTMNGQFSGADAVGIHWSLLMLTLFRDRTNEP